MSSSTAVDCISVQSTDGGRANGASNESGSGRPGGTSACPAISVPPLASVCVPASTTTYATWRSSSSPGPSPPPPYSWMVNDEPSAKGTQTVVRASGSTADCQLWPATGDGQNEPGTSEATTTGLEYSFSRSICTMPPLPGGTETIPASPIGCSSPPTSSKAPPSSSSRSPSACTSAASPS